MHRPTIGTAQATASDRPVTNHTSHAANTKHLYVTRTDPDPGAWTLTHAAPTPVRHDEFSQITLRKQTEWQSPTLPHEAI
ncbi:hypothetical protein GCM10010331_68910 [Streptomyces xanthochromogenes]|uniref:hypothetical protein n=1 Tax=Streptomyces xanthochromogenes TaxID=67384 RepID=UPI001676F1CC|nr:hypothetical protein [Streptomyces xanthochromogenes]GHB71270.1 hypothetical protein GCM10010331_68910 [Streptomyces xanthochromogenes]